MTRSRTILPLSLLLLCLGVDRGATAKEEVSKASEQSTLSRLGIDFGATELGRFAELGLTDDQKRSTLSVVQGQKPRIDKLCLRMTRALMMPEMTSDEKMAKQVELQKLVNEFKAVQADIMAGLHAVLTDEQKVKLVAIKEREKRQKLAAAEKAAEAEEKEKRTN